MNYGRNLREAEMLTLHLTPGESFVLGSSL
jgi:hypothetical protein